MKRSLMTIGVFAFVMTAPVFAQVNANAEVKKVEKAPALLLNEKVAKQKPSKEEGLINSNKINKEVKSEKKKEFKSASPAIKEED